AEVCVEKAGLHFRDTHTGATWFRRGRSIRMSCKPRSPVGLVNPPAKTKCEERSRTRCLTSVSWRRPLGLGPWPGGRRQPTGSAPKESHSPAARHLRRAGSSVGRWHTSRQARSKGHLRL